MLTSCAFRRQLTHERVRSMSSNGKVDNPKGVGLFGLIGLVVSSCIGSGVFALTGYRIHEGDQSYSVMVDGPFEPGAFRRLVHWFTLGLRPTSLMHE